MSSLSSLEMNGIFRVTNVVRGPWGDICLDGINRLSKTKQLFHWGKLRENGQNILKGNIHR